MEELAKEIQRLKEELEGKKKEVDDLKKWINRDIDRQFSSPIEEFSDRELDTLIRDGLAVVLLHVESKPDLRAITSHRKTFGKPIVLLKRALLETTFRRIDSFLDHQFQFNQQIAALCRAFLVRVQHNIEKMSRIEERASRWEEDLVILKNKIDDLRSRLDRIEPGPTDHPPK